MTEKVIFTDDQLTDMVDQYLTKHNKEIEEMIETKIRAAIRKAINDNFEYNHYDLNKCGPAYQQIEKLITAKINLLVNDLKIDTDDLNKKINKQLNNQINKLTKNMTLRF